MMKIIDELYKRSVLPRYIPIQQIKAYMINPIKIYVEQEEQVNLLFQQQQEQLYYYKNFSYIRGKIGGCTGTRS
jgi:hypothetical protein